MQHRGGTGHPGAVGAEQVGPALQRWVKWEEDPESRRDDTVFTQTVQARVPRPPSRAPPSFLSSRAEPALAGAVEGPAFSVLPEGTPDSFTAADPALTSWATFVSTSALTKGMRGSSRFRLAA